MRALWLAALLGLPAVAGASADAHDAVSLGAFSWAVDGGRARDALFAGFGGLGYAHAFGDRFAFATYDFGSSALEAGAAGRLGIAGRLQAWGSASVVVAPRAGLTLGPRGLVALGATFGQTLVVRPSVSVSAAYVGGPGFAAALLLPVEGSVEVGLRVGVVRPFLRFSAGADLLAASRFTGRGGVALCLALPE